MSVQRRAIQGFTLIEIIMVITIMGILAVSARALLSTEAFDQRFFFDDTLTAARYAQQVAVSQGCAVQFTLTSGGFSLKRDANCGTGNPQDYTTNVNRPNSSDAFTQSDVPTTTSISPDTTVIFYPQGWACNSNGTDNTTKSITFSGGFTRTLNIVCATGFVYDS